MAQLGIFGFGLVSISGDSMEPTFSSGDWLLIRWFSSVPTLLRAGKIYVVEREVQPGIFYVKRLQKSHGKLHWIEGDNPTSEDSRKWGWVPDDQFRGRVIRRMKRAR